MYSIDMVVSGFGGYCAAVSKGCRFSSISYRYSTNVIFS